MLAVFKFVTPTATNKKTRRLPRRRRETGRPWTARRWLGAATVALATLFAPVTHTGQAQRAPAHGWPPELAMDGTRPMIGSATLGARVQLRVPGRSRFAAEISGRDSVSRHLASMGLAWSRLNKRTPDFPLGPDEAGWLVELALWNDHRPVAMLVAATRDIEGEIVRIELFIHDETRLARLAPRDDGVVRTSLAAQRNLRQARALHGSGGNTRFLAANGARVLAILDSPQFGRASQLVQYRFDASGHVSSLRSAPPLVTPCCNSSGSNAISAFTITPP